MYYTPGMSEFYLSPSHYLQLTPEEQPNHTINLEEFSSRFGKDKLLEVMTMQLINDIQRVQLPLTIYLRRKGTDRELPPPERDQQLEKNTAAAINFLNSAFNIPKSCKVTRGNLIICYIPGSTKDEPQEFTLDQFSQPIKEAFTQAHQLLINPPDANGLSTLTPLGDVIRALSHATKLLYPTENPPTPPTS